MQSGLKVGDMILAINTESFLDISYDTVGCQSSL
jgi:C-terminal processing protease CtpA/Prc